MEINRSKERITKTGEIFTPPDLVIELLNHLPTDVWLENKTFCDPAAGDGNFLEEILKRKIGYGITPTSALTTIFGVDIMPDNILLCKKRLLRIAGNTPKHKSIVDTNIVCADSLKYDFMFGEPGLLEF